MSHSKQEEGVGFELLPVFLERLSMAELSSISEKEMATHSSVLA